MLRNHHFALIALLGAAQGPASPVVLHNGANAVDILGDGTRGVVTVAWRGNFNAHGHSDVAFSVLAPSDASDRAVWQVVPFFGSSRDSSRVEDVFGTTEGADCVLADLRVLSRAKTPVEVVIARRDFQRSYADSEAVHFDYYTLRHNTESIPGWPPWYFQYARTTESKRAYCDVNQAFASELHLGVTGAAHGGA